MDSTEGVICLHNVFVYSVSAICLVLASICLTKNVVHNPASILFFLCIMLVQFSYTYLSGSGCLSKRELNAGDFPYSFEFHPDTNMLWFYYFHLHLHSHHLFSQIPCSFPGKWHPCEGWSLRKASEPKLWM